MRYTLVFVALLTVACGHAEPTEPTPVSAPGGAITQPHVLPVQPLLPHPPVDTHPAPDPESEPEPAPEPVPAPDVPPPAQNSSYAAPPPPPGVIVPNGDGQCPAGLVVVLRDIPMCVTPDEAAGGGR